MDNFVFVGETFDDLFRDVLHELIANPQYECSPRGSKIKEKLATTLVLNNPRARLLSPKSREVNYGFGVGEFLWYWQGKRDLETMLYYNKRMNHFSDDGKTLNSAYGFRMKKHYYFGTELQASRGMTQWEAAKETLLTDPDSRRCVILINQPEDEVAALTVGSKDVPCTLSLQFFIRDGKLDLHSHMRSNDVMWGLTYDLFSFTLFQECMLLELKRNEKFKHLELGKYYHTAGSIHLYEHHFQQADRIVEEYKNGIELSKPMSSLTNLEQLDSLCVAEAELREGRQNSQTYVTSNETFMWMLNHLISHMEKRKAESGAAK